MNYVDVILPLPLDSCFTYLLAKGMEENVKIGSRVVVPFGKSKFYTGVVVNIHNNPPHSSVGLKVVFELLDSVPSILPNQLEFWRWLSSYYMCSIGDVMKAALPTGMKLESETRFDLVESFEDWEKLSKKETDLLDIVTQLSSKTVSAVQNVCKERSVLPYLRNLMAKGALVIYEEVKNSFQPKIEKHVRLSSFYSTEERINQLAELLQKQPKRYSLLMQYLELSSMPTALSLGNFELLTEVSKKKLLETSAISTSVLSGMIAKGYMEVYDFEIGRLQTPSESIIENLPLSDAQQHAFEQIRQSFVEKNVCLLHGVTASGKTEIYIRLIREQLEAGKQVLYLLPEIALTTQITNRLKRVFGENMIVYHSKFSDNERVEIWQKQISNKPAQLILGARSALFLPFQNLGLVIVDEEHEGSYKQQDPAPRYHARDGAIVMASQNKAKTLLGTATPSLESYYNVQIGKYGYAQLNERFGNVELPQIEVVDINDLLRRKMMQLPFSPRLKEEIAIALENKEQVILFQNRRGYTPMIECAQCGWVPKCECCDVSLTYHQAYHRLVCHYCGKSYSIPLCCPKCGSKNIKSLGFGTEKIEEEVKKLFSGAKTTRLDFDTTRSKRSYENIIQDFAEHRTDILIGTQMVSKGLDFDNVRVVGIIDADSMLTQPDFRAFEHSFQMMSQVAGRAGRRGKKGFVILQTRHSDYPVVNQIVKNDYEAMFNEVVQERKNFNYPPYCRLIYVYLKHRDDRLVDDAARQLTNSIRQYFGSFVLGPERPLVARVQLLYIRKIIIKIPQNTSISQVRNVLSLETKKLRAHALYHSVGVYFDVDPQ